MIFPSIDLMNGKVVQLEQGRKKKLELEESPLEVAQRFRKYTIQVIDLDAAMGKGSNLTIVRMLSKVAKVRVGGGIRTAEKAAEAIKAGSKKVIVSSSVFKDGKIDFIFLKELKKKIGRAKIIIAIDTLKGKIVVKGWKKSTGLEPLKVIEELEPYCSEFLCTYVDKEGMMKGTNINLFKKLRKATKNELTAAGGISSMEEIKKLEKLKINSVLGMALYTGKITLK